MSKRDPLEKIQAAELAAIAGDGPLHLRDLDHARTIIRGWQSAFSRWRTTAKRVHEENRLLRAIAEHEVEYLREQADLDVCDAGNPDGGSAETCEHCHLVERASMIASVLEEIDAAKAEAARALRGRLQDIAQRAVAEHRAAEDDHRARES